MQTKKVSGLLAANGPYDVHAHTHGRPVYRIRKTDSTSEVRGVRAAKRNNNARRETKTKYNNEMVNSVVGFKMY